MRMQGLIIKDVRDWRCEAHSHSHRGCAICASQDVHQLPKILASCDAVIRESTNAQATLIVEAKHRFPFVESKGVFTFMGRRRLPLKDMSAEYFAQCQLQMPVLNVMRCDLIS